jgi:hypothetical protein
MKTKDFTALGKALAVNLPKSCVRGPVTFLLPIGQILRGLQFDGSSLNADSFYVWSFILPLFIPTEFLHGSLGDRLRLQSGSDRWNRNYPDLLSTLSDVIQKDALPLLRRAATIPGAIEVLQERLANSGGKAGASREALAYCLAFQGEYSAAREHLQKYKALLDLRIAWQKTNADRADLLLAKMSEGQEAVASQLEQWTQLSIQNLKLESL